MQTMEASIITTYRCPMRCKMCGTWENPTDPKREWSPALLEKLPRLVLVNVTGGEPFVRGDLDDIVRVLFRKTHRVVISTSGWFEERVLALAERFPRLGFRISLEGLSQKNDELRGRSGGFDRGLRVILGLRRMGVKDIGFGITVSDSNSGDMLWLYELAKQLRVQFATAATHNSFYFHRHDNRFENQAEVCGDFEELARRMLSERHPKSWFRAYFNLGLVNYVKGNRRLLPCEAGTENFFVDPYGEVLPCNGTDRSDSMGNLKDVETFESLWRSPRAEEVRRRVAACPKSCWMIGSVSPVMKKHVAAVSRWVLKKRLLSMLGHRTSLASSGLLPSTRLGSTPLGSQGGWASRCEGRRGSDVRGCS
jgi:MoaA/NifB/PqqE/SkfB family radical SAM enzyme